MFSPSVCTSTSFVGPSRGADRHAPRQHQPGRGASRPGVQRAAADAIRLSRRTLRTIKGNLFWAFVYNVTLIPVAMLGFLNPLFAGAAMALSSVFMVANSLRLRRFRAERTATSRPAAPASVTPASEPTLVATP